MVRLPAFLTARRLVVALGLTALSLLLLSGSPRLPPLWSATAIGCALLLAAGFMLHRRRRARQAAAALGDMLETPAEASPGDALARAELQALRSRMRAAVRTIQRSRLGQHAGRAALYELPWYIAIGNPAAGKSSAILNAGLRFPFEDDAGRAVHGVGGTRNCDWFFTTEGVLLDTAGRYAVQAEDKGEWLGFLDLLRRHRPRAPINGIVVAVSIAELSAGPPEAALALARNLRQRIQELSERLEVQAPVYLVFTKADLIAGFDDFFRDFDAAERARVWGATLPCSAAAQGPAAAQLAHHFDALAAGLRELGVAQLARAGGNGSPALLAFPLEFAALRPALSSFTATLFEENPYQLQPLFRGFYLTSALQGGGQGPACGARIAARFDLAGRAPATTGERGEDGAYFLKDLFTRVIFADRDLVRRHTSPTRRRRRQAGFAVAVAAFGLALGGWTWSYGANRALVANVASDLDQARRLQHERSDLQSRLQALEILQDRIAQLERYRDHHPMQLGLGLYQGDALLASVRRHYFDGMRALMLEPVGLALERFLAAVAAHPPQAGDPAGTAAASLYRDARPDDAEDAYNALKTYLMLASRDHVDPGHLSDQLTRHWRGWLEANRGSMPREDLIRSAERVLSFHLGQSAAPDWPLLRNNLALVDAARERLRGVARGMPAADRVYAQIKARAATRFPAVTVAGTVSASDKALIAGSRIVSGAFTAAAWQDYVRPAIREAAIREQDGSDWVLKTTMHADLTLEGSPEQIQKALTARYKREYAEAWADFLQGVEIVGFADFDAAVVAMNRLGDVRESPIARVLQTVFKHTAWDLAGTAVPSPPAATAEGFAGWLRATLPALADGKTVAEALPAVAESGEVGEAFSGLARFMAPRADGPSPAAAYLQQLAAVRSRLNALRHGGDPGPGAVALLRATLEGRDSELAEALRFIEEDALASFPEAQRAALRPLLLRPLQQSFAAVLGPGERELNRIWVAQVVEPFRRQLAPKYPFSADAGIEATAAEIAQIFGADGAIARFADQAMGALVVRRGDTVTARTWGELGIGLSPAFTRDFSHWVGPLDGAGGSAPQTAFMLMPHPAAGITEYVVEVDGQQLRYRNGAAQWANFVWPGSGGVPGARITATTFDGRQVEVAAFVGRFGLEKLINAATRLRKPDGSFQMSWSAADLTVTADLRIVSSTRAQAAGSRQRGFVGLQLPDAVAGLAPPDAGSDRKP